MLTLGSGQAKQTFETMICTTITAALTTTSTTQNTAAAISDEQIDPKTPQLHTKTTIVLAEARKLLAIWENLSIAQPNPTKISEIAVKFKKNLAEVKEGIAAGRRTTEQDIEDLLGDKLNERGLHNEKLLTEEKQITARDVLLMGSDENRPRVETEGWGEVAAKAAKGVRKMEKAMAKDP